MAVTISSGELCSRSGATYRQVDYWTRIGLLAPETPVDGSGRPRRFPVDAVRTAAVLMAASEMWHDRKTRKAVAEAAAAGVPARICRAGGVTVVVTVETESRL